MKTVARPQGPHPRNTSDLSAEAPKAVSPVAAARRGWPAWAARVRGWPFNSVRARLAVMVAFEIAVSAATALIILAYLRQQEADGRLINLAGMQRMLLTRTNLQASEIALGFNDKPQALEQTIGRIDAALRSLRYGEPAQGIPKPNPTVRRRLLTVVAGWAPYRDRLQVLLSQPPSSGQFAESLQYVSARSPQLVAEMDAVVAAYEADLAGKVQTLMRTVILLAVGGSVLAAAAWWLVLDRFARPLSDLADGAARLGNGELSHRVNIHSQDEVGLVAREFNTMAARLEHALGRLQRQHDVILNSAGQGIYGIDLDGNVTFVNPAAAKIIGWEIDHLVGKPAHEVLHHTRKDGTHYSVMDCLIHMPFERLAAYRSDVEVFWKKDGSSFPVEYVCNSMHDPHGAVTGAVIAFQDITERTVTQETLLRNIQLLDRSAELERMTAELQRSNAELEQFAYVASHDLQEPLRMVASFTQLLARRYAGKLDADADEFIGHAVDGATRMQALIRDLLAYSRAGGRGAPLQRVELSLVFTEALANLRAAVSDSGAVITADELPVVLGDRQRLVQVFQNLLSNSIKFRREEAPRVHVGARREDHQWLVSVQDNGIGISPEFHRKLFNPFQRLQKSEKYPGTGIGLAICRKVVEAHGGKIWIESAAGQGATFCLTLPDPSDDLD